MSDPLPPQSPPDTEDEDGQKEALLFARCSPAVANDKDGAAAAGGKSAATSGLLGSPLTSWHVGISLGCSILVSLTVLLAGQWLWPEKAAPRQASEAPAPTAVSAPAAAAAPDAALKAQLAKSAEQIAALEKQLDVMRREQLLMQQNTRQSLESISATLKIPEIAAPSGAAATGQPGTPRMPDMRPQVSPTQEEFIQLKERNRLTMYADEAIATGERRPIELLVEYMRDPQQEHLHDAAQAEYLRAIRAIQLLQREDPGYRLPVAELFKDSSIRDEADVPPAALLKLLADYKQPWEVRVRVCFLLLGSPLPETNTQLIKAIKEDPSLEVAKHAQLALEQRIKKRFRIFDIPAIEEWLKSQGK